MASPVFAEMKDALEWELHPVVAQPGDLLERLLEPKHRGARLVPVTLAQHAPQGPEHAKLHDDGVRMSLGYCLKFK